MGQLLWLFLKKLNTALPYVPATPLLGKDATEEKAGSQTDTCTPTFTAALFTEIKRQKRPKSSSTNDWISKTWHVHDEVLFSLEKEILTHATTWKNLEDITLSEINQSRKNKYCMIPHTPGTQGCHSERQEVEGGSQGLERGRRGVVH